MANYTHTYKPQMPFTVPFKILTPTLTTIKGTRTKIFTESETVYFCSFRTFGGTEMTENGVYSVVDTAIIDTWFTDQITADCRIHNLQNGQVYEVIGTPENINMRNQYLKFRVRAIKGGA